MSRSIDYDHSLNLHTAEGPSAALRALFATARPASLIDVGCGTGTWLRAASELGITDYVGIDGVRLRNDQLLFPYERFVYQDLTAPWKIGRRFAAALCLEVAEHLDAVHAPSLIDSLVAHADTIYFSAACPGQLGQHHVNCQWPSFWQQLFNDRGYMCSDDARWLIWNDRTIEPWYRQNLFVASRATDNSAGQERRIPAVIHPDLLSSLSACNEHTQRGETLSAITAGSEPLSWYATIAFRGIAGKTRRAIRRVLAHTP